MRTTIREELSASAQRFIDMSEECEWPFLWRCCVIGALTALVGISIILFC
jgi:hypothetical protein